VPSIRTVPPEAAVIVKDPILPALAAAAFLPSRVSESIVKIAPEFIIKVSPADLADESKVCDVEIVAINYLL
jgi:hypothetical protein